MRSRFIEGPLHAITPKAEPFMVHLSSFTRRAALAGGSLAVASAMFPMTTQSQTSRPLL